MGKMNEYDRQQKELVHAMEIAYADGVYDGVGDPSEAAAKQVGGDHYKGMAIEPWKIIQANKLNYWEGNALKYLLRYKDKNGIEDLKKAIHYIEYLIEQEKY